MRKTILGLLAALSFLAPSVAAAQTCPTVAALPDSERRVAYSPSASTGPFSITFAILGDSTDYSNWIEVWLNGTRLTGVTDWQLTIPSGTLATACRPITNASVTLTTAATGTLQIVGARRPRRTSQFAENAGVSARNLNQVITDIVATERETWDKINDVTGRGLFSQPGNVMGRLPLPAACASSFLTFDATGLQPQCSSIASTGTLIVPSSTTAGQVAIWNNTTGTSLADGGNALLYASAFGIVADGTTINTTNLQAAETARAANGGVLIFNGGIYKTGPITINRSLGGGWVCLTYCRFTPSANSQTMLTLSNAVTSDSLMREFYLDGISINGNGFTGITAIAETSARLTALRNLTIVNVQYAANFDRGRGISLSNIMQGGTGTWLFTDSTGSSNIFDIAINNITAVSNGGHSWGGLPWLYFNRAINANVNNCNSGSLDGSAIGMKLEGASEGLFFNNCIIVFPTTGVSMVADGSSNAPSYVNFTNFAVDQPNVDGMNLLGTAIRLTAANVTNGAQRTNSGSGIVVKAASADVTMVGVRVQNNNKDGITVETGATAKLSDLELIGNNVVVGAFYDLNLQASTAANVVLHGKNNLGVTFASAQNIVDSRTPVASQGFRGSSSGATTVQASATASGTLTLPAATDTLAGLGGTNSWSGVNTFANATDATNSTTAGTVVSGGLAVAKKLRMGDGIFPGPGTISAGIGQIYTTTGGGANGLTITAHTSGGTNDFGFFSAAGPELLTNPSGTTRLRLTSGGASTVGSGTLETDVGNLFVTNLLATGGFTRVTNNFAKTSDTTLADVTGLTATLIAGKTYKFEALLYTTSNVAGGVKFAIAGTATATSIIYEAISHSGGTGIAVGTSRATALAAAVGDVTAATVNYVRITGTITVNAAGTLTVQFAQNASNGAASTVLAGSTFEVFKFN